LSWEGLEAESDGAEWWAEVSLLCFCLSIPIHTDCCMRSLIALSLILALLQFKPAPMYILDEVDAALDLSHTQNIGRLIKTRFKGSQFIVVSLKDGMFQNANRVFRTRFSEGTSVVSVMTPGELR
jgi:structural maintenance of chromosome 2